MEFVRKFVENFLWFFSERKALIFKYDEIYQCHRKIKEENAIVTDDTSVVERYGHKVYLYEGDYTNIKITTPEDLILAERLI